jgi:ribosomal protein S18 acetylase RimI-like enzyme
MAKTAPSLAEISIGAMEHTEAQQLFSMARAEGWNPGAFDLACAWAYDPDAFVALRYRGTMIAGGSIFRHNPSFGFMGLFIVDPEFRGLGLGRKLWHERLERLRGRLAPDAVIAMDGVFAMEHFYAAGGFEPHHETTRYQGVARCAVVPLIDPALRLDSLPDVDAVLSLDREHTPYDRTGLLRLWLERKETLCSCVLRDGELVGFGLARPAAAGFKIGPVIAKDALSAQALIADLVAKLGGQQIQIDVPEPILAARTIALGYGLAPVFGCRRMYFGASPETDLSSTYAAMSLEFG